MKSTYKWEKDFFRPSSWAFHAKAFLRKPPGSGHTGRRASARRLLLPEAVSPESAAVRSVRVPARSPARLLGCPPAAWARLPAAARVKHGFSAGTGFPVSLLTGGVHPSVSASLLDLGHRAHPGPRRKCRHPWVATWSRKFQVGLRSRRDAGCCSGVGLCRSLPDRPPYHLCPEPGSWWRVAVFSRQQRSFTQSL